jgi:cysteine desulfurase / selenocysteine lyase
MPIDVTKARRETRGCEHVVHLNNAGAALIPDPVLDAVIGHLELEARIGGYEAAERRAADIEHAYQAAGSVLNCSAREIAICESATRAWQVAVCSIPFRPGDRILLSTAEYANNVIAARQVAARAGATVELIPNGRDGTLSLDALAAMLDHRVRLVAVTHVPTHEGVVNPAAEAASLARAAGALSLLDACQSLGQIELDVRAIGCSLMTAAGRKFLRGPRGTGVLFVSQDVVGELEPWPVGVHGARWVTADRFEMRSDARRFESWEANYAARIGLGVAFDYARALGLGEIQRRVTALAERLRGMLAAVAGVEVRDRGTERCGIVTFTLPHLEPEAVEASLRGQGINVSVSIPEYARFDFEDRGIDGVVRASVHYYNTDQELERLCGAVSAMCAAGSVGVMSD